jgi:hypothetical protein
MQNQLQQTLLLAWTLLLVATLPARGQNIGDLFKTMPSEHLPGVYEGNKTMLLIDTLQTPIPCMAGEIRKLKHTADWLMIETSAVGTLQLKLLPVSPDSAIICLISTVCPGACDSHITFHTTGWKKIENVAFFPEISGKIFFNSSQKAMENYKNNVSLHHANPVSAEFSENGSDLTLTFNYRSYQTRERIAEMEPLLKSDTVTLKWENGSFRESNPPLPHP